MRSHVTLFYRFGNLFELIRRGYQSLFISPRKIPPKGQSFSKHQLSELKRAAKASSHAENLSIFKSIEGWFNLCVPFDQDTRRAEIILNIHNKETPSTFPLHEVQG